MIGPEQTAWVRHHHERADGHGYPAGLAGDQIPEGASLIAVADAFDVMTSGRAYAGPRTPEASLAENPEPLRQPVLGAGRARPGGGARQDEATREARTLAWAAAATPRAPAA